ncbi:AMP-binding enzyme [Catenulispora rubra]|uniref:AMP-binding enzyme n=1 Tax=Catenulispora rubra TaxID=280293 RepID=UPI00189231BA|nr:hypothetical protein [Catenulispora rubra]
MSGRAAARGLRTPGRAAGAVRPAPRARVRVRVRVWTKKDPAASPEQLESAALTVAGVAEAAAVPVHDELRGRLVEVYVVPRPGSNRSAIEREIHRIAMPKNVWIVADLPKTHSGGIARCVLAGISNFTDVGDTTGLANPEIVEGIQRQVQAAKLERGETPTKLTREQIEEIRAFGQSE